MQLLSIRIITENTSELVRFYETITGIKATWYTDDFAELSTTCASLAIASTKTWHQFGGDQIAKAVSNQTSIIEFITSDVDQTYSSLKHLLTSCLVQAPTTMPWGNRSLLFRDPDGNLVNFFTPITPEAIHKFKEKADL